MDLRTAANAYFDVNIPPGKWLVVGTGLASFGVGGSSVELAMDMEVVRLGVVF